ncbi:MAG: NAD-dependent epimerase/dehydratase family protein [Candidatus Hydrogenedentota bacterium]
MTISDKIQGARCVVTGAAGFIGAHLCARLLQCGARVTGIDCFTNYYDPALKRRNVSGLVADPAFKLMEADLARTDLKPIVADAEIIFHLAAQAGVRASWGEDFSLYTDRNVLATQRLLDAVSRLDRAKPRFVFASSSSVYGDSESLPTMETAPRRPISPYGATKSLCEDLLRVYGKAMGIPWTALRYFTVYGPRQRPDMAFQKLLLLARDGGEFTVFGDGSQKRDVTYVLDAVEATIAAGVVPEAIHEVFNIGGGRMLILRDVLEYVRSFACPDFRLTYADFQPGDARDTGASIEKARRILGYNPSVSWQEGLLEQRKALL